MYKILFIYLLFLPHISANTNYIGWLRLEQNELVPEQRYVFSDLKDEKHLKDAYIKFDLKFVPENI